MIGEIIIITDENESFPVRFRRNRPAEYQDCAGSSSNVLDPKMS